MTDLAVLARAVIATVRAAGRVGVAEQDLRSGLLALSRLSDEDVTELLEVMEVAGGLTRRAGQLRARRVRRVATVRRPPRPAAKAGAAAGSDDVFRVVCTKCSSQFGYPASYYNGDSRRAQGAAEERVRMQPRCRDCGGRMLVKSV